MNYLFMKWNTFLFILTIILISTASTYDINIDGIEDKLAIRDDQNKVVDTYTLEETTYMGQQKDLEWKGSLCAENTQIGFKLHCYNDWKVKSKDKEPAWIWMTNSYKDLDSSFLFSIEYGIQGIILIKDDPLTSDEAKTAPDSIKFIFRINNQEATKLEQYDAIESDLKYTLTINHNMIYDCSIISDPMPIYYVLIAFWCTMSVIWGCSVYYFYRSNKQPIHHILMCTGPSKVLELLFYAILVWTCPWDNKYVERYITMMLIALTTIFVTLLFGILLATAKGYGISTSNLSKNQTTVLVIILGCVYLGNSAYYVANPGSTVQDVIRGFVGFLYLLMEYLIHKELMKSYNALKIIESLLRELELVELIGATNRKRKTILSLVGINHLLFPSCILLFFLLPLIITERAPQHIFQIINQFVFLIVTIVILVVFYPKWTEMDFTGTLFEGLSNMDGEMINENSIPSLWRMVVDPNIIINSKYHIFPEYIETQNMSVRECIAAKPMFVINPVDIHNPQYNEELLANMQMARSNEE